jgi:hypothetical protein
VPECQARRVAQSRYVLRASNKGVKALLAVPRVTGELLDRELAQAAAMTPEPATKADRGSVCAQAREVVGRVRGVS